MKTVLTFIIIITTFTFGNSNAQNLKSDDPLNGPKKEYHANGKISREYIMTNGVPNGQYKSYSESGVLLSVQNLLDGIPHGIQKTFFENGKVRAEYNMENGKPKGITKEYFENGTLKSDSYLTGEPWEYTGYTTLYFEDGRKKSESKVSMGKLVIAITYDKEGRGWIEPPEWSLYMNVIQPGWVGGFNRKPDLFTIPEKKETIAPGIDVYDGECFVLYNPDRPDYWLPVAVKEAFDVIYEWNKKNSDEVKWSYAKKMLDEEQAVFSPGDWNKIAGLVWRSK